MAKALWLAAIGGRGALYSWGRLALAQQNPSTNPPPGFIVNLAIAAKVSASYVSGDQTLDAPNNGYDPKDSRDARHRALGNWPRNGTQWVQYDWSQPISTNKIDVYWFADGAGIRLPSQSRLLY